MQTDSLLHNRAFWIVLLGCLGGVLCGLLLCMGTILFVLWSAEDSSVVKDILLTETAVMPTATVFTLPTSTSPASTPEAMPETAVSPTATPLSFLPHVPGRINTTPIPQTAHETLQRLFTTNPPPRDYFEAAVRLNNQDYGARTSPPPAFTLGDTQLFYTDDGTISARLMAITPHTYFWVEDTLRLDKDEVLAAANQFENEYYPAIVNIFGQEWQPGMDNDPHFSVLHINGQNNPNELGYFNSGDEYPRTLFDTSNEQEIIYMVMSNLDFGSELYFATLIHETQHMVQWFVDPNETIWLNEGLSQLAETMMGLDTVYTEDYLEQPQIRLNRWENDEDVVDAHYAAAYLYTLYLWERFGDEAIQELSRHPANGLTAVQEVLAERGSSWLSFTSDWAVANFLDDPDAGPVYDYSHVELERPSFTHTITRLPFETVNHLGQFAVDYIELDFRGPATLTFAGDTSVPIVETTPTEGDYMWLAPAANESNFWLMAEFDLTELTQATLTFDAWYNLEEEYDFAYLSISTDGGKTWTLLVPENNSPGEFGPAWNGRSATAKDAFNSGWVHESISLNPYVGHNVWLRFDVLTDSSVVGQGFALDNIAIPELGFKDGAESDTAFWETGGFVRAAGQLPQYWSVQLIQFSPAPYITQLALNELNQGKWEIEVGKGGAVLVIMPLTPFTDQDTNYWLEIVSPPDSPE
ncbi:MAG: hypothetical protein D6706_19130 [Chloroflexi bacterium]|nr:MAG: hypothetical protein D6706_19130 [Chloroflexota bacterium]